ncbi:hypothetical protein Tco_0253015 [Tanacetum coccineum]
MDDPNITIEEYIRLKEEKARKLGKVFNWETAKYGRIWYDEDVHDLRSVETEFPAIIFNDNLTSNETLSYEPTVSSLNDNEIDFTKYGVLVHLTFFFATSLLQEMDDPNITMEEYIQLMADKARGRDQTFNWETATYGKVYCDDSDLFTDFETDFPDIVYNDASTSNQNVSFEPTVNIYNAIKSDIHFYISFSDFEDEEYTFLYNKESSSYKLTPINDLKPEPVNDYVEINIESCSENIDVKPMDSVICISKDTTPVEFDENFETNHDIHRINTTYPRVMDVLQLLVIASTAGEDCRKYSKSLLLLVVKLLLLVLVTTARRVSAVRV